MARFPIISTRDSGAVVQIIFGKVLADLSKLGGCLGHGAAASSGMGDGEQGRSTASLAEMDEADEFEELEEELEAGPASTLA